MPNIATNKYNSRAPSKLLWEWNRVDFTQFGDGAGNGDHTYGTPDGTLTVGAVPGSGIDVPSGNVLIYTTGIATGAMEYYFINDLPPIPERVLFRARLGPNDFGCKPMMFLGGQDELHNMSFTWEPSQTTFQLANNSTGIIGGGHYLRTGGVDSPASGATFEADIMLRDPDTGVDPQMCVQIQGGGVDAMACGKGGPAWTDWGTFSAIYHSSWQSGGTIKNLGFIFLCNAAAKQSWISELQILSHPWEG